MYISIYPQHTININRSWILSQCHLMTRAVFSCADLIFVDQETCSQISQALWQQVTWTQPSCRFAPSALSNCWWNQRCHVMVMTLMTGTAPTCSSTCRLAAHQERGRWKSWLTIICSYYSWIILIFNVVFWYFFGGFLQWINGGSRRSPWLSIPLDTKGLASVPSCRWSIATSPNSWCHMILPMPHAMGPAISQCKEGLWLLFLYL